MEGNGQTRTNKRQVHIQNNSFLRRGPQAIHFFYLIKQKKLYGLRSSSILIHSHHINGLEMDLPPNISKEDKWQRTTADEWETNSFQQQFLALIRSHLINGLEAHLRPKLSTEDGWQWTGTNKIQIHSNNKSLSVCKISIESRCTYTLNYQDMAKSNEERRRNKRDIHFEQQFFVMSCMQNIKRVDLHPLSKLSRYEGKHCKNMNE